MQLRNRQKILITFVVFALLLSSILAAMTYTNLSSYQTTSTLATVAAPTPPPFQLQVASPLNNYTYGTYNGPQNITADEAAHQTTYNLIIPLTITVNQENLSITYSVDGSDNITFNENTTASLALGYGVHNLTAYATNIEGIATQSNITFTIGYAYPPINNVTIEQVQQTARYFESRGLKVQVEAIDKSKWQNIVYFLSGGSVIFVSKENFADAVIAYGIDTIWITQDPNYVGFYVKIYGPESPMPSLLPIFYGYSATIV